MDGTFRLYRDRTHRTLDNVWFFNLAMFLSVWEWFLLCDYSGFLYHNYWERVFFSISSSLMRGKSRRGWCPCWGQTWEICFSYPFSKDSGNRILRVAASIHRGKGSFYCRNRSCMLFCWSWAGGCISLLSDWMMRMVQCPYPFKAVCFREGVSVFWDWVVEAVLNVLLRVIH